MIQCHEIAPFEEGDDPIRIRSRRRRCATDVVGVFFGGSVAQLVLPQSLTLTQLQRPNEEVVLFVAATSGDVDRVRPDHGR